MPSYGKKSMAGIMSCERDIQVTMHEVIKVYDHSVIFGHREAELQFELFQKGRKFVGSPGEEQNPAKWVVVDPKKVVTYRDGFERKSEHNYYPSRAIDIAPYPINWGNEQTQIGRFYQLSGIVLTINKRLYDEGKVTRLLRWGGDWDSDGDFTDQRFHDLPHYELIW